MEENGVLIWFILVSQLQRNFVIHHFPGDGDNEDMFSFGDM